MSFTAPLDDRGAPVTYRDPMFHGSTLSQADRERINRHSDRSHRLLGVVAITGAIPPLLTILLTQSFPAFLALLGGMVVLTTLIWMLILPPLRRARWERDWKLRYKQSGLCPACQCDLRALTPDVDACTVCPQCGGAWRMQFDVPVSTGA